MLPEAVGLIVTWDGEAELVRPAPEHPMASARRRGLLLRFAQLAALRLTAIDDPAASADLRVALRAE